MGILLRDEINFSIEPTFQTILFENDFKALLPELFLIIITLFLLLYGVVYSTSSKKNYPLLLENISWLSLLTLLFTFFLLINNPLTQAVVFYNTLVLDEFAFFFKILVVIGAFFSILIAIDYMKSESMNAFEYMILVLLSTCSMLFLIASADFISMYLALEMQSLCFYVMASWKRTSEFSTEAGLKYFLLGAFSSGILLFGCSMIYGFTGITNFFELAKLFTCGADEVLSGTSALRACDLGMIFILVGLLFKLTAVPFHMWAPDVYEGAPTSVTLFFSIAPKVSILGVFLRIFVDSFFDFMLPWQKILIFCSLASMIVGALAAMSQNKIKRLLAFSSIGHVGYLLIGFCCGTVEGLQALFIYLVIYLIMTLNLFSLVLTPVRRDFMHSVERAKYITDFAMLGKTNPILALTLTITMFSIAGIPPLAGFYSKAFLFFAAMSSTMYILAFVGVITSVISCFYYIRLIKIMYFETPKKSCSFSRVTQENSITLGITFFFLIFFMAYPSPLYLFSHKIALFLCS
jgi:proton-translocating NADH-quinone oxidoreductase chain N